MTAVVTVLGIWLAVALLIGSVVGRCMARESRTPVRSTDRGLDLVTSGGTWTWAATPRNVAEPLSGS